MRVAARTGVLLLTFSELCLVPLASGRAQECIPPARQVSKEALKGFTDNPSSLLSQSGGKLAASVRNLAVTSPAAVDAMPGLMAGATAEQAGAIGSGLGQASLVCRRTAPDMALAIQKNIVGSNKQEVIAAYEAVVQEEVTTAVSPGATAPDTSYAVSGDSNQGGGPFPNSDSERAGGVLPLTAYYATPTARATSPGGRTVTVSIVSSTTLIQSTSTTLVTALTPSALQSVSPSR